MLLPVSLYVSKEPTGLFRTDGKRPDGLTLVQWQSGKELCWDVTVICPLADSYVVGTARKAGSAAELAAARKDSSTDGRYLFEPIAIETLGVYSMSARQLLSELGRKISHAVYRGSQRGELSLSEMLSAGAAFQHSFTSQQFAGL